ncbi:ribonuclease HIII [bacterium]|nr:ribonuclease HIII [bacterium]
MNCVIRVSDKTKEKMIKYYEDKKRDKVIPYVIFQAQDGDTVITMYESGKIMFQGTTADVDSSMWLEMDGQSKKDSPEVKEKEKKYYYCSSIGSDEVGTGDYFGPIVVTASFVKNEDIPYLEELGIKDSKKLTDEKILDIAPKVAKKISYKSLILSNQEYNEKHGSNNNMNKIKAIMHNKVLYQMVQEIKEKYDYIIVDEFARENRYYDYIKDMKEIQRGITFMTKAEDKNLAVACSSVISRYIFLKEFDKLSDSLHIPLPKGAGANVDVIGEEIVDKYGQDKLKEVAKLNFANTERILKTVIF